MEQIVPHSTKDDKVDFLEKKIKQLNISEQLHKKDKNILTQQLDKLERANDELQQEIIEFKIQLRKLGLIQ